MLDVKSLQKGVRITASTPQDLVDALKARRREIKEIVDERRPAYAQGKLSEVADGIWSKTTIDFVQHLGAVGLQLNGVWAQLPPDWRCPCCNRSKSDIIIFDAESKVAIAQAVEHHDHFVGYVNQAFHRELGQNWIRHFPGAVEVQRRLVAGTIAFDNVVVCEPCNFAEGKAKSVLKHAVNVTSEFLEHFSFSIDEIRQFVRPVKNSHHRIDHGLALDIIEKKRKLHVMSFRKAAVDSEAQLVKNGEHRRSCEMPAPDVIAVQESYNDVITLYGVEDSPNFCMLSLSATDQNLKVDPDAWIIARPKKSGTVYDHEANVFLANSPVAAELGLGWRCPCCGRSLRATLRRNNKRKLVCEKREVRPGSKELVTVCLDCHTAMNQLSGSANCERDDVVFEDIRQVNEFRISQRHRVRSADIVWAVVEQIRQRVDVIRDAENKEEAADWDRISTKHPRLPKGMRSRSRNTGHAGVY